MARISGPSCRLCRREGTKLFLKGERCYTAKCSVSRRSYFPGQHGQRRSKLSDYGRQLREKQKLKRMYGILERQFRRYFQMAERTRGITGIILLQLLERRLDNVVYRLGAAASRPQARQLVRHGFILVDDRRVNIPSYLVKQGALLRVKGDEKQLKQIRDRVKARKDSGAPDWIEADPEKLTGKILRLPEKADIQQPIQEQLIVELYSK